MGWLSSLFGGSSDSEGGDRQSEILQEQKTLGVAIRSQQNALSRASRSLSSLEKNRDRHESGTPEWDDADRHVRSAEEQVAAIENDIRQLNQQMSDLTEEYVRIGNGG